MEKAVFLDKDGTLVENVPYNIDPDKIRLSLGAETGLQQLQREGYLLIVISNQPGIAKGLFQPDALRAVEKKLTGMLALSGIRLDGFYYCPHHPDGIVERFRIHCSCRKPEAGLLLQAAREHGIDMSSSWMIGDILNDIEAGRRAGCRTILIDNGNETEWILSRERLPHHLCENLHQAAGIIRHSGSGVPAYESDL